MFYSAITKELLAFGIGPKEDIREDDSLSRENILHAQIRGI